MEKKFIGNGLEVSDLDAIAKIIKDNDLERIKIKNGDFELCIESRKKCPPPPMNMPPMPMPMGMGGTCVQGEAKTSDAPAKAAAVAGKQVKAPIVGTFYASSSPDSKPFVSVGQRVKKGDTIFIIESMKVMSEVQSEYDGVVREICVNSGDSVEFDQTIMILD